LEDRISLPVEKVRQLGIPKGTAIPKRQEPERVGTLDFFFF